MSNLLSKRLNYVVDMVSNVSTVADVGCDHGYTAIELVKTKKATKAICTDLREGPLMRAREHIYANNLADKIELRLSDGLNGLRKGEAEAIVIAGMGGMLIKNILAANIDIVRSANELILSPQSDLEAFRRYLYENRLHIIDEKMVKEEGKYYPIIKVVNASDDLELPTDISLRYGPILLDNKDETLYDYLVYESKQLSVLLDKLKENKVESRIKEVMMLIDDNKEAISNYEMC